MSETTQPKESTNTQVKTTEINMNNPGTYLDGWADLIEGIGDKEKHVRSHIYTALTKRKIPDAKLGAHHTFKDYYGDDKRYYIISRKKPGVTTSIYANKHGDDLYVSWRSFIKPVLNAMIVVIIVIALLIGYGATTRVNSWIVTDIQVFIAAVIVAVIIETALVAGLGFYLQKDPFALFFKRVTILDAEDICAMNLSIHKTIIRALDNAGIDVKKLRIKEKFSGGRKGEDI